MPENKILLSQLALLSQVQEKSNPKLKPVSQKRLAVAKHLQLRQAQREKEENNHPFLDELDSEEQQLLLNLERRTAPRNQRLVKQQKRPVKLLQQNSQQSPTKQVAQRKEPVNKLLLEQSRQLEELIRTSEHEVASVTKLVTDSLAIGQLALFNGFEDANEILKNTLGEDPRLGYLSSQAEKYLQLASKAKLVTLASKLLKLTPEEEQLYRIQVRVRDFGVSSGGADILESLLTSVSSLRKEKSR